MALTLSPQERSWLAERGEIRYCSDSGWMPFEGLDRRGRHIGIGADFIREFSRLLNIPMRRISTRNWSEAMEKGRMRECDMLSLTNPSAERRQFFNFTEPYVVLPVVLFGPKGSGYLDGLDALDGQPLALQRDGILVTKVRAANSLVDIRQYTSSMDQLTAVVKGEARAAAMPLPVGLYHIQKLGLTSLEVSGHTSLRMELGLAVRNDEPILVELLNRAVQEVTPSLQNQITRRWYSVEVQQAQDYTLLMSLTVVLAIVVAFLLYRNRISRRFADQMATVNARLSDRNQRLEQVCKRDFLTGVLNRVSLDAEIDRALQRAAQQCHPMALLLLDLDRFSGVNRRRGHQAGDMVLVEVCRVLEQNQPDWVRLGRWSGDRFLLISPRSSREEAQSIARKLSITLQVHQYSEDVHISASFCIAICDGSEQAATLLHSMERRLSEARQVGPQQIVMLDEPAQYSDGPEEPAA